MAEFTSKDNFNVIIGVTGSVATIKLPLLIDCLRKSKFRFTIKVVATEHSKHFFDSKNLDGVEVLYDQDEWASWGKRGDPVLHIELRKWADVLIIAPLDANTLAKISNGICDNLLTCVVRAWEMKKPLLFAPAMNTHMWTHPITQCQINTLKGLGFSEVTCIEKALVCGDEGMGAMAEVGDISSILEKELNNENNNEK